MNNNIRNVMQVNDVEKLNQYINYFDFTKDFEGEVTINTFILAMRFYRQFKQTDFCDLGIGQTQLSKIERMPKQKISLSTFIILSKVLDFDMSILNACRTLKNGIILVPKDQISKYIGEI